MLKVRNWLGSYRKLLIIMLIIMSALGGLVYLYVYKPNKMSPAEKEMKRVYEQSLKTQVNDTDQQKIFAVEKDLNDVRQLIAQNKLQPSFDTINSLKIKYKDDKLTLDNLDTYLLDICIKMPKQDCIDDRLVVYQTNPQQYARLTLWVAGRLDETNQQKLAATYYRNALQIIDSNGGNKMIDQINATDNEIQYDYKLIQGKAQ